MRTTSVVIAEDHTIVRQGLKSLLGQCSDLQVVGEAQDGLEAVEVARKLNPNVMIMDLRMPNLSGVEACRQITKHIPGVRVIALTLLAEERFVREMFQAGASGYLLKDCDLDEMLRAIETVLAGKMYLSPELAGTVMGKSGESEGSHSSAEKQHLSDREREVLRFVAEGKTTKQIAEQLGIRAKTVETHRHNLMQKLGLFNIADLTKYAISVGLTTSQIRQGAWNQPPIA